MRSNSMPSELCCPQSQFDMMPAIINEAPKSAIRPHSHTFPRPCCNGKLLTPLVGECVVTDPAWLDVLCAGETKGFAESAPPALRSATERTALTTCKNASCWFGCCEIGFPSVGTARSFP